MRNSFVLYIHNTCNNKHRIKNNNWFLAFAFIALQKTSKVINLTCEALDVMAQVFK